MKKLAFLAGCLLVLGCAPVDSDPVNDVEEIEQEGQPIVGGATYTGDPAIGRLDFSDGTYCTGTLIGSRTVLTAAHCVTVNLNTYSSMEVSGGVTKRTPNVALKQGSVTFYTTTLNGVTTGTPSAATNPYQFAPTYRYYEVSNNGTYTFFNTRDDTALVTLASDVAGVTPLELALVPPTATQDVELIGYGASGVDAQGNQTGGGVKRRTTGKVASVDTTYHYAQVNSTNGSSNYCLGDSGGPLIGVQGTRRVIFGDVSNVDLGCTSWSKSSYTSVNLQWIMTHATAGTAVRPWTNRQSIWDSSGDGFIAPNDSLFIINYLNTYGSLDLRTAPAANLPTAWLDVDGDGFIAPIDSLLVINKLNNP